MAMYVDADKLYSKVKEKTNPYGKPTLDYKSGVKVLNMIKQMLKTDDAVEVIRCEDCKLRYTEGCPAMFWDCSGELMGDTEDNDFCSYGERSDT